jgi:ABC-2 type transport system ATP-binding protein
MPLLTAVGAGVRQGRRWLFRDLNVVAEPGDIVAVVGPPGSGRTTALLALADRFQLSAGSVSLSGTAELAYVPGVTEPEPALTVADHLRERQVLLGRPGHSTTDLSGLDPERKASRLSPYEKQVLGLIMAAVGDPNVIAVDGMDDRLSTAERAALWQRLDELAGSGMAVLVTAREVDPDRVTTVVRLGDGEQE